MTETSMSGSSQRSRGRCCSRRQASLSCVFISCCSTCCSDGSTVNMSSTCNKVASAPLAVVALIQRWQS